jgi:hypothetical protein
VGPYYLYVGSAALTLAISVMLLLDRPKDLFSVLVSVSAVLLIGLDAVGVINPFIVVGTAFCFLLVGGSLYVGFVLVREIAAALNHKAGLRIVTETAILWLPLVIFFFAASFATNLIHQLVAEQLYSVTDPSWSCKPTEFVLCRDKDGIFQDSLLLTNSQFFSDASAAVRKRVETLRVLPEETKPQFQKKADEAIFGGDPVVPPADKFVPHMDECGWVWAWPGNWPRCIRALIQNKVHNAYDAFRTRLQRDLDDSIDKEFTQSQSMADNAANVVYLNLDRQLHRAKEATDRSIDVFYFGWNGLSLLSLILAVLLSLKILLYILVRFIFDETYSEIGCALSDQRPGRIAISAAQVLTKTNSSRPSVQLEFPDHVWYIAASSGTAEPNRNGTFCWPHKPEAFIRRLIHSKLFFNRYPAHTPPITINTAVTNGFCRIDLKEGDCFAFSMKSLFAFTDDVTFHLAIRIRAAILLQRRFLFATATGPGTIILVAKGADPSILPSPPDVYANIDDVIGLDFHGSIYTAVQKTFIDTYFRSFAVRSKDTLMIREAPNPQWSLARLLRRFAALLLPF